MSQTAATRVETAPRVAAAPRPHLAPGAIQGLEVLALPVTELTTYVRNVVDRNPLLDMEDDEFVVALDDFIAEDSDESEESDITWADAPESRRFRGPAPDASSVFDVSRVRDECSVTETLHSHLRSQLREANGYGVPLALAGAVIEGIDDNGYFGGSLPAICLEMGYAVDEGERALTYVQSLNPRGVGARTIRECLLLQLDDDAPNVEVVRELIENNLEDLAENRTTKLMRAYRLSLDQLLEIRRFITGLEPRPGAGFSQRKSTVYVVPDLVVERRGSSYGVRVVGEIAERLVRHREYEDVVAASGDAEAATWLADKGVEADAVLANVAQRKRTLLRFGTYLVDAQYEFFCRGEAAMRPLTMQQVADGLGVHVSTVSRIVQDKHILTPWGTYPLKHFFTSGVPCATGRGSHVASSRAVKERIKQLIEAENARSPLSDAALTEILNREGVEIKRRTVAKYREALGIPRQSQRRR